PNSSSTTPITTIQCQRLMEPIGLTLCNDRPHSTEASPHHSKEPRPRSLQKQEPAVDLARPVDTPAFVSWMERNANSDGVRPDSTPQRAAGRPRSCGALTRLPLPPRAPRSPP